MRYMPTAYSPNDPIYFHKKIKEPIGHFHGGAGYVMSKEALKRFVTEALPDEEKCRQEDDGQEDDQLGTCMLNVGVYPRDARDREELFFHLQVFGTGTLCTT